MAVTAFVSLDDVKAHLRLLAAFHDLRNAQGSEDKWAAFVAKCVIKFDTWMTENEGLSEEELREKVAQVDLEVLLVWHSYLLNPLKYLQASQSTYPALSKLGSFPLQTANLRNASPALDMPLAASHPARGDFDLVAAVLRQGSFISKVDGLGWTRYPSESMLLQSIERYGTFLDLMASGAVKSLVPTLDIDLVWHTHQLKGARYREDTQRLLGHVLDHNDNIPEGKLSVDFAATEAAWKTLKGSPYIQICGPTQDIASCGGGCNGNCGSCGAHLIEKGYLRDMRGGCGGLAASITALKCSSAPIS